jgi:hypothetical protein
MGSVGVGTPKSTPDWGLGTGDWGLGRERSLGAEASSALMASLPSPQSLVPQSPLFSP